MIFILLLKTIYLFRLPLRIIFDEVHLVEKTSYYQKNTHSARFVSPLYEILMYVINIYFGNDGTQASSLHDDALETNTPLLLYRIFSLLFSMLSFYFLKKIFLIGKIDAFIFTNLLFLDSAHLLITSLALPEGLLFFILTYSIYKILKNETPYLCCIIPSIRFSGLGFVMSVSIYKRNIKIFLLSVFTLFITYYIHESISSKKTYFTEIENINNENIKIKLLNIFDGTYLSTSFDLFPQAYNYQKYGSGNYQVFSKKYYEDKVLDEYSIWEIEKLENNNHIISGDIIKMKNLRTKKYMFSADIQSPLTTRNLEISCTDSVVEDNYFRILSVFNSQKISFGDLIYLEHLKSSSYVTNLSRKLPKYAENNKEVSGSRKMSTRGIWLVCKADGTVKNPNIMSFAILDLFKEGQFNTSFQIFHKFRVISLKDVLIKIYDTIFEFFKSSLKSEKNIIYNYDLVIYYENSLTLMIFSILGLIIYIYNQLWRDPKHSHTYFMFQSIITNFIIQMLFFKHLYQNYFNLIIGYIHFLFVIKHLKNNYIVNILKIWLIVGVIFEFLDQNFV